MMLLAKQSLQQVLKLVLEQRIRQGCALEKEVFNRRIDAASDSYDALFALALELRSPPQRADWAYREPLEWRDIRTESASLDPAQPWSQPDFDKAAENARTAFLSSVCGCMLGKPIEVDPTLAELKNAGNSCGEWPLDDYVSKAFLERLGRRHESWDVTVRESLDHAVADDDLHYSIIGMLLLEESGREFTHKQMYEKWASNIPPAWAWGPERTALLGLGLAQHHVLSHAEFEDSHDVLLLNPGDESCGAMIRVDAYGYACPGNPDLAAWLAFKDASLTHTRTGVYGAMFIAALIAVCQEADPGLTGNARLELVEQALLRIPRKSRLAEVIGDTMNKVASANNWEAGYEAVHGRYSEFTHCQVYQEIGTLINSIKFATSIDHGFCIQVSQGNDTDSFGATVGSILGCFFGQDFLGERWVEPLNGRLEHGLSDFHEYSMAAIAARMGRLPELVYRNGAEMVAHV